MSAAAAHPATSFPAAAPDRPAAGEGAALQKVYVWEVPVRLTHWLIALSIVVLAATGFYIGHPFLIAAGEARRLFIMGTVKAVHSYTAIVFTLAVLARIGWMFAGNRYARWDKFLPAGRARRKGMWPTLKFYLFFLRKPPGFVGHNPLAGMIYSAVFLLYLTEMTTGFALYSVSAHVGSPMRAFGFLLPILGGAQIARLIHHTVMWLLLGFAVHHVYSALLMAQIEQNATMESIFSGYKFVPPEDLVHSGYRFEPRPTDVPALPALLEKLDGEKRPAEGKEAG